MEGNKGGIRMGRKFIVVGLFIAMSLLLSGCFFSEQTLIIGPDGKADVKVEFWFDKTQAGAQGAIAIQELLYLFPELQDYEMTRTEKRIEYTTYLIYSFQAKGVDINKNRYIDFAKKDDGSYSLTIRIPKAIEEKKEKNDKVLTVKITLPTEIDMANTMNYEGRTAEWELRTNDFARDITLKIFTKTTEETLRFSTPENTIKTLVETIALGGKDFASQCFSNKQYAALSEIVMRNFYEVLKEQNLIPQVKKLTYFTTELDEETCLVWICPPGNDKKSLSWKVIREEGRWYALSYCYYRLSSGINWNLEDLAEWKDKGYKLQNFKLTDELDSKETCLISIFTPFSDNPDWPGPESGTFGPLDEYSQSLNNALVIYRIEGKDAKKLSQCELPSGPNDISLKLMDIDNNGSKEIVVKNTWCGASACSYKIEIFDFRDNHLIQIRTPDRSYKLVDINKDGVYELLSEGFSYWWDCRPNRVTSSLVWRLREDQYKRDSLSFATFYQDEIREIKIRMVEELSKSEEKFDSGNYFRDVISLYVNYVYINQNERGCREVEEWLSKSIFISAWDKYYKTRLGSFEDIIENVKLEMNKWETRKTEDVCSEVTKSVAPEPEKKQLKGEEKKIAITEQKVQPFFDFSTPENTTRSFMEAIFFEDNEKAKECWSNKIPELVIMFTIMAMQETFQEEIKPALKSKEALKLFLWALDYKKEQIDKKSFYVWFVIPGGDSSKDSAWRVVKEGADWKILVPRDLEDDPIFRSLIEEMK